MASQIQYSIATIMISVKRENVGQ